MYLIGTGDLQQGKVHPYTGQLTNTKLSPWLLEIGVHELEN